MKTFIGVLLVGFMGFLGCSGSDDTTSTTSTAVGEAVPVAPFGIMDTMTPRYQWTPIQYATRYRLLVQDIAEETIIDEWFTAEEGECSSEEGLCSVTPDVEVVGNTWKVLACAGEECGLWSDELQFSYVVADPVEPRFEDIGDGTVMDYNTFLMWAKDAPMSGRLLFSEAISYCDGLSLGGNQDWRLPSLAELNSLIDRSQFLPALPPGHPFNVVGEISNYWTVTSCCNVLPGLVWFVVLTQGDVICHRSFSSWETKPKGFYAWPVRLAN
jgi:hypothetical protein